MQSVELVLTPPPARNGNEDKRAATVSDTTKNTEKLNCNFFCRVPILAGLITTLFLFAL